jgi:hypothetical protein
MEELNKFFLLTIFFTDVIAFISSKIFILLLLNGIFFIDEEFDLRALSLFKGVTC